MGSQKRADFARIIAGKRAKEEGAFFEHFIKSTCMRQGVAFARIPDGARQISAKKFIRIRTPFDAIMAYRGEALVCDMKSYFVSGLQRKMLIPHQVESLHDMATAGGIRAGYLVHLRKAERIVFYPAETLWALLKFGKCDKNNAIDLGSFFTLDLIKLFR